MSQGLTVSDFEFEDERLREMTQGQNNKLDSQLHVQFYKHAELNSFETTRQGRKIFDEHVYIRILAPANRLNVIERRVTDDDRARFRKQFVAFVERGESLQSGTPLESLTTITQSQVLELKALKVDTVEQLAGMADTTTQLLGTGGQDLKQRAQRFMDKTGDSEKLSAEVRALRAQLDEVLARQRQDQLDPTKQLAEVTITTSKA